MLLRLMQCFSSGAEAKFEYVAQNTGIMLRLCISLDPVGFNNVLDAR